MILDKRVLDGMIGRALEAAARDRESGAPLTKAALPVAAEVAQVITAQFAGDEAIAGRAVMAISQMLEGLAIRFWEGWPGDPSAAIARTLALAAEQVVREAGERS